MQFCEKLDFLMNLTKTTNSALSLYISLDASYVSRLRSGKRRPAQKVIFAEKMAAFFARRCTEEYRRRALFDRMQISPCSCDEAALSGLILQWLVKEKGPMETVEEFLSGFSSIRPGVALPAGREPDGAEIPLPTAELSVYYGVEGKRRAVLYFLNEVLAQSKPQTLLLFSDEPTEWMTGDREFAAEWAVLMLRVLAKGNRIRIIHTVSRVLDEMLNAIAQWMPLYMSGNIEPYYYPKKRDGIFRRTLFIAPDTAAIISSSIGKMDDRAANILFRNKMAVESYAEEFRQYFSLCRPLMRIFTEKDQDSYFNTLLEFERKQRDSMIRTESISILTMPESVASSIDARMERAGPGFFEHRKERMKYFEKNIRTNSFTEIIYLPDAASVQTVGVKVASSDMMRSGAVYYTPEEYVRHVEHLAHLIRTYENFHVCLTEKPPEDSYMVYAREDLGAVVAKISKPSVILDIEESNMTAAFWDYLKYVIRDHLREGRDRRDTLEKLCCYARQLREGLASG